MVELGVAATRLSQLATRVVGGLLIACATAAALTGCSIRSVTFTPEETPPPEAGIPDAAQPIDAGLPDTDGPGNPAMATVIISRGGTALGAVSAEGITLSCAETCRAVVPVGTVVALTAIPDLGAVFGGWTGGCSGTDATCRLTVTADVAVTARFDVARFAVELGLIGDGSGAITSTPAGLDCPGACAMTVPYGTMVELVASPSQGSTFLGWSGACTGTGRCLVTVTAATSVTATFAANNSLIVVRAGTGTGSVTSSPAGIDCGADCVESYLPGTVVTLSAAAAADSTFTGWTGGGCSGTGTCQITMSAATQVTATFALRRFDLVVARAGSGSGAVTSSPAGINCGTDCSETYDAHTQVTLTASPAADSTFTGWTGGGCSGTGTCVVTLNDNTTVTATFALRRFDLVVTRAGNGSGAVTSSPAGINCGTDCSETYDAHTQVTLTASPAADSVFTGWTGGCTGTGACVVTLNDNTTVTATFALRRFDLVVTRAGNGSGAVTSSPAGINCGTDCSETYDAHTQVTLTASPAADSVFTGWTGGGCSGTGTCQITLNAATQVTATFALRRFDLVVARAGNGSGAVTSSPAGINCGTDCSETYDAHTQVTLTASPAADSVFTGWTGGGCSGTGTCVVTINDNTTVTATFALRRFDLVVTRAGNGTGTVTSSPAGINCGTDCQETYDAHTQVTLTASPAADSTFTGWSGGGCSGTGACVVTINDNTAVTATFALRRFDLVVARAGNGSGAVTSSPAGINCGTDCSETYDAHTQVTLTASPAADSTFTGWTGGGCSDTGTCQITMNAATQVTASFALRRFDLLVTRAGNGTGTVTSSPAGINCGTDCSETYDTGTVVTLTAAAAAGSKFTGWSGACAGIGTCQVTLTNTTSVAATFTLLTRLLAVANSSPPSVAVFNAGASDNAAPLRVISGPATTLLFPAAVAVANDEIFVVDPSTGAIDVFPLTANGNVAPSRQITGVGASLSSSSVAVFGDEIFVGGDSVTVEVFPRSARGNVAPSRILFGPAEVTGVAVADAELFTVDTDVRQISAYPIGASDGTPPNRTITFNDQFDGFGIAVQGGEILISAADINSLQHPQIRVYPQSGSGQIQPRRIITGGNTRLSGPTGLVSFAGEIYVASRDNNRVLVFPIGGNGDIVPTRQLLGLGRPVSVFVYEF